MEPPKGVAPPVCFIGIRKDSTGIPNTVCCIPMNPQAASLGIQGPESSKSQRNPVKAPGTKLGQLGRLHVLSGEVFPLW